MRAIIDNGFNRAKEALTTHRAVLDRLAALLVEKETIESEEFESLFEGVVPPRSGGPTLKRIPSATDVPSTEGDVEPETDEDGGAKRRRPGPAPQPA